jgi:formylglycine-generating enzyme required for sulfatase activity
LKNLLLVSLILLAEHSWAFTDCSDCPEMIDIPAGNFLMGSPSNKNPSSREKLDDRGDEKPQHKVKIKEFSLGKFEVTQA